MTNTKFRKRALLSSVAMLLVALVALGSATFAWFVANPTVSASGLVMKTTAAPGLTVASASAKKVSSTNAFGYSTVLDARTYDATNGFQGPTAANDQKSMLLSPASLDTGVTTVSEATTGFSFGTITAEKSGAATKVSETPFTKAPTYTFFKNADQGGDGVYKEALYVKTSDTAAADAQIEIQAIRVDINTASTDAKNISSGARVAIADKDGKLLGVWAPSTATNTTCYDSTKSDGSTKTASFNTTGFTLKAEANSNLGVATTSDSANYYTVYVYLDGEDTNVYTDNVGSAMADIISSIDIQISTKNADIAALT